MTTKQKIFESKEETMPLEKKTLYHILERSVRLYADLPALAFVDKKPITYAEFYKKVKATAAKLSAKGFSKGDKIALFSENQPGWGIAYFGITGAGCIAVPILPDFTEYDVKNIITHSESKAVIVSKKLSKKVENIQNSEIIVLEELVETSGKEKESESYNMHVPTEDDLLCIIYTSGTTGKSKGVMLTHKNIVSNALSAKPLSPIRPGATLLSILPLSHAYEFTIGFIIPIYSGACVYYIEGLPTPRILMPALKKVKPILMLTVPLIIEKIYRKSVLPSFKKNKIISLLYTSPPFRKLLNRLAGKKLMRVFGGKLEFFGIGGAPVAPDVEKFMREAHFPYAMGYGLTETSPLIAGSSPYTSKFRAIGPPIKDVEVKIDNPNPETGEGEILVRGPNVMQGYYKNEEETKKVFTKDGFFRTGDLGFLDNDNQLFIRGRLKNVILGPNGENIYPEEIEALINEYEYVDESIVYADEGHLIARIKLNYDELVKEFQSDVQSLKESASHISQNISEHVQRYIKQLHEEVNKKLKGFSRISRIEEQKDAFEKTPTHKIKRYLYTHISHNSEKKDNKKNQKI